MAKPTKAKFLRTLKIAILAAGLPLLLCQSGWTQSPTSTPIDSNFAPYFNQLTDTNTDNDEVARKALKQMGAVIVDPLIRQLENPNVQARRVASSFLGEFGPAAKKAIISLTTRLQTDSDGEVRSGSAISLGQIGPAANAALPTLISALKTDKDQDVRVYAAQAIGQIAPTNPETFQALSKSLRSDADLDVQKMAAAMLVEVADQSSEQFRQTLNDIKSTLNDPNWQVRLAGAIALAANGRDIQPSLSTLNNLLQKKDPEIRKQAMEALSYIAKQLRFKAEKLSSAERTDAEKGLHTSIEALKVVKHDLEVSGEITELDVQEINTLINLLGGTIQLIKSSSFIDKLVELIEKNPVALGMIGLSLWTISLLSLWSLLLGLRPLWLWKISGVLPNLEKIPLPPQLAQFLKPIHYVSLIAFFHYHPRVLDAWVQANLTTAQRKFSHQRTVKERSIYIPIPVVVNGQDVAHLTSQYMQAEFVEKLVCILIWGEGGSGKTSLACELARWAMSNDPKQRLCKHRMLPILLEQELDFEVLAGKQVLIEAIRGKLRDLLNAPEPISEDFLKQLLKQQRLLVIVDRLSEMSEATRQQIRPDIPEFPINALIVTSRIEEKLGGVNRTTLKPMRIAGNYLSEFMGSYLTYQGKRELFTDREFFEACSRLSTIAENRDITVLLAKLYAEQLIAVKFGTTTDTIPDNIPELILCYLNQLNQAVTDHPLDNRTIHHDAKIIAWECLRHTYQPTSAKRDTILTVLRQEKAENHLDYLENRLCIIQTIGAAQDQIRFTLDPVAEYLAALYLVEIYGNNKPAWQNVFAKWDMQLDVQKETASIQGFLLALSDCCLSNPGKIKLPDFLVQELQQRLRHD